MRLSVVGILSFAALLSPWAQADIVPSILGQGDRYIRFTLSPHAWMVHAQDGSERDARDKLQRKHGWSDAFVETLDDYVKIEHCRYDAGAMIPKTSSCLPLTTADTFYHLSTFDLMRDNANILAIYGGKTLIAIYAAGGITGWAGKVAPGWGVTTHSIGQAAKSPLWGALTSYPTKTFYYASAAGATSWAAAGDLFSAISENFNKANLLQWRKYTTADVFRGSKDVEVLDMTLADFVARSQKNAYVAVDEETLATRFEKDPYLIATTIEDIAHRMTMQIRSKDGSMDGYNTLVSPDPSRLPNHVYPISANPQRVDPLIGTTRLGRPIFGRTYLALEGFGELEQLEKAYALLTSKGHQAWISSNFSSSQPLGNLSTENTLLVMTSEHQPPAPDAIADLLRKEILAEVDIGMDVCTVAQTPPHLVELPDHWAHHQAVVKVLSSTKTLTNIEAMVTFDRTFGMPAHLATVNGRTVIVAGPFDTRSELLSALRDHGLEEVISTSTSRP